MKAAFRTWWLNGRGMTITHGNLDKLKSETLRIEYAAELIDIIYKHKHQIERDGYAIILMPEKFLLLNYEDHMKLLFCCNEYEIYANTQTMFICY